MDNIRIEPASFVNEKGEKIAYHRCIITIADHDFIIKFRKVDQALALYLLQHEKNKED